MLLSASAKILDSKQQKLTLPTLNGKRIYWKDVGQFTELTQEFGKADAVSRQELREARQQKSSDQDILYLLLDPGTTAGFCHCCNPNLLIPSS